MQHGPGVLSALARIAPHWCAYRAKNARDVVDAHAKGPSEAR